ncbi:MAG: hypothetical protein KatS3mg015_2804 [Fimbriimonadales bacterium]|nr:MAG: hypothetical protein KatS3mg015_2804 [Fimbriimonadales bacterium]
MAKARFISRYGAFSVGVQSQITENFATGKQRVIQKRIDANFHNRLVTDEDFAVALGAFQFPGLPEDFDTNSHVSPRYRVSVWDSEWARENEGWTDEEIDLIIETLRRDPGLGTDFIELTPRPTEAPWPTYDESDLETIIAVVQATGIDPERVIAYERENANRKEVLDALLGVEADDDLVVVNAG